MRIPFTKKKLVLFVADENKEHDALIDELAKKIKEKNPSWTKKECREAAELTKQSFGLIFDLIINSIFDSIEQKNVNKSENTAIEKEIDHLMIKFEEFAKRKGIH